MAAQLGDFSASNTSANVQTIGAGCSNSTPCQIRTGAAVFTMTAPVTLTISGVNASGTVFWYLSSSEILTAGYNSPATLTCSAGCSTSPGVTAFPADSTPLWQTTFTANVWSGIDPSTMDKRAILSRNVIMPGSGVSSLTNANNGVQTLSTDPTIVPRYFGGAGPPSGSCAAGRDFYTDTTGQNLFFCASANTWKQAGPQSPMFSVWQGQTAAVTMNATDLAIYSATMPAGALGAGECLEMEFGNIHSAGTAAIAVKLVLGPTTLPLLTSSDGSNWNWHLLWCNNPGSTNAQQLTAFPVQLGTGFSPLSINEITTTAIDTTQAVTIRLTANGPGTDTETGTYWRVRVTQ